MKLSIGYFIGGMAAGSIATLIVTKILKGKEYATEVIKEADDENFMNPPEEPDKETEEYITLNNVDKNEQKEKERLTNRYKDIINNSKYKEEERVKFEDLDVFLITTEDYDHGEPEYDKDSMVYYKSNDSLFMNGANIYDEVKIDGILGPEGRDAIECGEEIFYHRNRKIKIDYEVIVEDVDESEDDITEEDLNG